MRLPFKLKFGASLYHINNRINRLSVFVFGNKAAMSGHAYKADFFNSKLGKGRIKYICHKPPQNYQIPYINYRITHLICDKSIIY